MGNDKTDFARLFELEAKVHKLIIEDKRAAKPIIDYLQGVIDTAEPVFVEEKVLLVFESTWSIYSSRQPFVAENYLKVGVSLEAPIPIKRLGSNLVWFLEKIEEPVKEGKLRVDRLHKLSLDGPIIKDLGGEEKVETTLQEMLQFLTKAHKEDWYIFYIKDARGILRVVDAVWLDSGLVGWQIEAYEIGQRGGNNPKMCVVSRMHKA